MDEMFLEFVLAIFGAMLLQTWYLQRAIQKSRRESIDHTNWSHDQLRADFSDHKTAMHHAHDQLRADFKEDHDQLRADFSEHKVITERNHRETQRLLAKLGEGLGDARERLARIEGYLRIGLPRDPPAAAADG